MLHFDLLSLEMLAVLVPPLTCLPFGHTSIGSSLSRSASADVARTARSLSVITASRTSGSLSAVLVDCQGQAQDALRNDGNSATQQHEALTGADTMQSPEVEHKQHRTSHRESSLQFACAYAALGATIGLVAGLSSAAVTLPLLATLLSLMSAGTIHLLTRLQPEHREMLTRSILCFSLGFFLCLILGISAKENRWLSGARAAERTAQSPYLKSIDQSTATTIEALCRRGDIAAVHDLLATEK